MLPFLSILFVTIQINDQYLIEMSNNWVIIQFLLILCRLMPFLFYDVQETFHFKRTMTLYVSIFILLFSYNLISFFLRACDTWLLLPYKLYQFFWVFVHNNEYFLLKIWEMVKIRKTYVFPLFFFLN